MATVKRDFAILGGGPGGYTAAIRAARTGASVVLVEKDGVGGTCLLRGCIPTKSYVESARAYSCVRHAADHGVRASLEGIDWSIAKKRKDDVVDRLRKGVEFLLKKNNVEVVRAEGRIDSTGRLDAGGTLFEAGAVIVAAGSEPVKLPGLEPDGRVVLDSSQALDLDDMPASIVVIGGGVIGCEFASIFSTIGCEVTIVELLPRILPGADGSVAKEIERALKKKKVKIHVSEKVERLDRGDGRAAVVTSSGREIRAERVLVSVGRRPSGSSAVDPSLGIAGAKGDVPVDERCMTRHPGIWAIGDVTGGAMLAHRASHMAAVAVDNASGHSRTVCGALPSCLFTTPEAAWVGVTEEEAASQGLSVSIGTFPFRALGRAHAAAEIDGMVKVVCLRDSKKIVGFHAVGPHATDIVAEGVLAVRLGLTARQIEETIHAHPTFPEAVAEAAADALGLAIHV